MWVGGFKCGKIPLELHFSLENEKTNKRAYSEGQDLVNNQTFSKWPTSCSAWVKLIPLPTVNDLVRWDLSSSNDGNKSGNEDAGQSWAVAEDINDAGGCLGGTKSGKDATRQNRIVMQGGSHGTNARGSEPKSGNLRSEQTWSKRKIDKGARSGQSWTLMRSRKNAFADGQADRKIGSKDDPIILLDQSTDDSVIVLDETTDDGDNDDETFVESNDEPVIIISTLKEATLDVNNNVSELVGEPECFDDSVWVTRHKVERICPITKLPFQNPQRNVCGHVYEEEAILRLWLLRSIHRKTTPCPVAGCQSIIDHDKLVPSPR